MSSVRKPHGNGRVTETTQLFSDIRKSFVVRDFLVAVAIAALCYLAAVAFGFADVIAVWARALNSGESQQVLILLLLLSLIGYLSVFIHRRSRDLREARKLVEAYVQQWEAVFQGITDAICLVDAQNRILRCNHGMCRLADRSVEELLGGELAQVLYGDVEPEPTCPLNRVLQTGRTHFAKHQTPDGRCLEIAADPIVDHAGRPERAVVIVRDVTERVHLEEVVVQSEKMMSLGGLAAGMAHEINNPLAGIMQSAAVLRERLMEDLPKNVVAAGDVGLDLKVMRDFMSRRRVPAMLENIVQAGERAAKVVENMLSFARPSSSEMAPCLLTELLDETIELARNDYGLKKQYGFKDIAVRREYDANVVPVFCARSKVEQVFLNILRNGAEAMNEKVEPGYKPEFTLRVACRGDVVRVEIEDNGPGLDEGRRKRVFEPFYTTKSIGTGTGLGLSVSYFIITENHRGSMTVKSCLGEWTRFCIELPLKQPS